LGDNWALKSSNLRKLLRNLENYYHFELRKDADWSAIDMQKLARTGDAENICVLCQLVAAAAVTCPDKNVYVQRIMSMTPDSQVAMKGIIEESMQRLSEYVDEEEEIMGDENELVFGQSHVTMEEGEEEDDNNNNNRQQLFGAANTTSNLEQQLEEVQRELATVKSQLAVATEESEKAESKLRALVEDLQDRLMKRQDELIQVEEDLQQTVSELEETKSKLAETVEQKAVLEDDLDVAKAKAQQLYKAEATVVAYKKKLEGVGVMNQQMEDLEGQAEKYLQQIMELESEVKRSAALQKTVTSQEETIAKLEKSLAENVSATKNAATEVSDLKSRLNAAESAKKMYEEELTELRAKQHVDNAAEALSPMNSTSSNTAPSSSEQREKTMRLEIENRQLREQIEKLTATATVAPIAAATEVVAADGQSVSTATTTTEPHIAIAVPTATDTPETVALKAEIQRLFEAYTTKEKENAKIASDKDKLEAYTKRTLAKFQDKYLVALQECKAKLKEKQDKIELLEKRSAAERTAQKREERLLSSTIYELGLGIMQNKLKNTSVSST
jgi:protein HOOK3